MNETRRRLLAVLGTTPVATLAGCLGDDDGGTEDDDASEADEDDGNDDGASEADGTNGDDDGAGDADGTDGDDDGAGDGGSDRSESLPLQQQTKLAPDDGDDGDAFGGSVAVSGDGSTAVVGGWGDEDPNGENAGSAYVFSQAGGGWQQETKLLPDDGDDGDLFNGFAAVSGDGSTAIIGANGDEDPNGESAGSAYVFSQTGGAWRQQAKLLPDDGDDGDLFGISVAVSSDGSTAVVGGWGDEDPNGENAGSAYVFSGAGGGWQQEAKLLPDDGDDGDFFGWSVAVSSDGSTAVVGAYGDSDPNNALGGAAYVFSRAGGGWQQEAKLSADGGNAGDQFGFSVAVSGDGSTALIGADGNEDPNGREAGSAYVFSQAGGGWQQEAKLLPDDGDGDDQFGYLVAISDDGETAIGGAPDDEDPNGEGAGSAYVFSRADGDWQQETKLVPDDGDSGDSFGLSAAMSGDGSTVVVGAWKDEEPNGEGAGSAYVFA